MKIVVASSTTYHAQDPSDRRFYILATLGSGILRFEVVARLLTGERSSLKGREFFAAMMSHFGAKVRTIESNWTQSSGKTTNLDQVNAATAAGLAIEDACSLTWTGLRASEFGFDKVTLDHALPRGASGSYNDIRVTFGL